METKMAVNDSKDKTAMIKNKGCSMFGGQRIRLNSRSYIRKHSGEKSLIIKASREELNTATNIGLLLMKSFNILDIMSFLTFNNKQESEN